MRRQTQNFISEKKGGLGIKNFTREYIGSLLRDIEVFISEPGDNTAHALLASIEAASHLNIWSLYHEGRIPKDTEAFTKASNIIISGKLNHHFQDNPDTPSHRGITHDYTHTMERAVRNTSALGFLLRNLNEELCSRFAEEIMMKDRLSKALGSLQYTNRASLGAYIGVGNKHLYKYSIFGHVYILLHAIIEEAKNRVSNPDDRHISNQVQKILTQNNIYLQLKCFPKEISNTRLSQAARDCFKKFTNDYKWGSFINLSEPRLYRKYICTYTHTA